VTQSTSFFGYIFIQNIQETQTSYPVGELKCGYSVWAWNKADIRKSHVKNKHNSSYKLY